MPAALVTGASKGIGTAGRLPIPANTGSSLVVLGMHMDVECTSYLNLPVYTPGGRYVGVVRNVVLDLPNRRVGSLLLTRTSQKLVEGGHDIAVPYRWVASVGDIVILSSFPAKVVPPAEEEAEEEEALTA